MRILTMMFALLVACGGTAPAPAPIPGPAPAADMSTPDLAKSCPGVDLMGDPKNCGACGNVCPSGAASACQRGVCVASFAPACRSCSQSDPGSCGGVPSLCGCYPGPACCCR